jgi:AcrR family transcriptional regulator
MTGLRERKKEQTRRQIIAASAACFAEQGLDGTTMEEVAAAADVSVGTLYNYFGSKTTLLLAVVAGDVPAVASRGAPVLADPGHDPVAAVGRILDIYLDIYLELGRDLMREVFRASFDSTYDLMPELIRIDQQLLEELATLLAHFRSERLVAIDVSGDEAAMLLFSILTTNLIVYVSFDDLSQADIRAQVRRQVDVAFHGLSVGAQPNPARTS